VYVYRRRSYSDRWVNTTETEAHFSLVRHVDREYDSDVSLSSSVSLVYKLEAT